MLRPPLVPSSPACPEGCCQGFTDQEIDREVMTRRGAMGEWGRGNFYRPMFSIIEDYNEHDTDSWIHKKDAYHFEPHDLNVEGVSLVL